MSAHSRPGKRAYLLVTLFLCLLVVLPFLFWYFTWFGRPLTDQEITEYLSDTAKPRHAQHALVQIGERLSRGERSARQWYPKVAALAGSPVVELRQTAAWIMGQDHSYDPFHEALRKLLTDPAEMVRRNAALALSNYHDPAAREELVAMLRPYTIRSDQAGKVQYRLRLGEFVNPGTLVARVGATEVRAEVPGEVREISQRDGMTVQPGDGLAEIGANKDHAWEALRALWSVGERADLDDVRRYARGVPGMPEQVQQQAVLTAQAIESRGK
ncbi:MAG TPA: HEAT repeat domain-containing protein [Bryobacteraceae bacterium]|nr:HEAT repeat domain-containing protein [Bryobacteraceae bacterium]